MTPAEYILVGFVLAFAGRFYPVAEAIVAKKFGVSPKQLGAYQEASDGE